jgi:hypothetical protein
VAADGLIFNAYTNSTSECGLEKKYNLFNHNDELYFAGVTGQLIIRLINWQWKIFKINLNSKVHLLTGYTRQEKYIYEDLITIIGINLMSCYIPWEAKPVTELFKLTNVSKEKKTLLQKYLINFDHYPFVHLKYIETINNKSTQMVPYGEIE